MNTNKIVIYITITFVVLIIGIPTLYKVIKTNHEKLYIVTNKKVIEAAERCYNEDKCISNIVTLKELYEKNYLEDVVIDPVKKSVYNEESYVEIKEKDSTFYPKK